MDAWTMSVMAKVTDETLPLILVLVMLHWPLLSVGFWQEPEPEAPALQTPYTVAPSTGYLFSSRTVMVTVASHLLPGPVTRALPLKE